MGCWFLCLALLLPSLYICGVSTFNLTILHTNDIHAHIEQFNKYGGPCSDDAASKGKCFGGYPRLKTKVDELRAKHPNSHLLLDGGDQSQGTLWFYEFGGDIMATFMNLLRYDAMCLGNHEFDRGVKPQLINFLKKVSFPVVDCNLDMSKVPEMQPLTAPYTIFTRKGQKIGVIGYTTVDTPSISQTDGVVFNPEVESVRAAVEKLQAEGINKIIALGHSGFVMDKKIADNVRGVDVVVGGHTNTFLYTGEPPSIEKPEGPYPTVRKNPDGDSVLVVQDYTFAKYLGHLQVEFDDSGRVIAWSGNPILLDNSTARDPEILAAMKPFQQKLKGLMTEVVGRSSVFLDGDRSVCRIRECNMGNLITDGMVYSAISLPDTSPLANTRLAMMNGGGIRASLEKGNITMAAILQVQPFRNIIDVVELTGQTLLDTFEYCASRWVDNTEDAFGGFLQVSGIKLVYDMRKPVNHRVMEVKLLCSECRVPEYRPLNRTRVYKVLMQTFVYNGGDGYSMLKTDKIKIHSYEVLDNAILRNYIEKFSPINAYVEERITLVDDNNENKFYCADSAAYVITSLPLLFFNIMATKLIS